jgi:hypothetical protein
MAVKPPAVNGTTPTSPIHRDGVYLDRRADQ